MGEHQSNFERQQAEIKNLEQAIFAARNYVVPSQDLRPRLLESAKEYCGQKRRLRRMGFGAIAASLLWFFLAPAFSSMSGYQSQLSGPSRTDMERAALELSSQKGYGPNWGLVEAFIKFRSIDPER